MLALYRNDSNARRGRRIGNANGGEVAVEDREILYRSIDVRIGIDHFHLVFGHLIPHLQKQGCFGPNRKACFEQKENVSCPFVHEFSDV